MNIYIVLKANCIKKHCMIGMGYIIISYLHFVTLILAQT